MLPSSTLVTPSVLAMVPTSTVLPLNENADVRAATFSASIFDSALSSSSARPSQKCSLSTSALMLANGSTASDVMARGVAVDPAVASCGGVSASWRAAGAARPTSPPSACFALVRSSSNSAAVAYRCARSFCSARLTIAATAGGTFVSGGGSRVRTATMMSVAVPAANGDVPDSSSYRSAPKLKRSVC